MSLASISKDYFADWFTSLCKKYGVSMEQTLTYGIIGRRSYTVTVRDLYERLQASRMDRPSFMGKGAHVENSPIATWLFWGSHIRWYVKEDMYRPRNTKPLPKRWAKQHTDCALREHFRHWVSAAREIDAIPADETVLLNEDVNGKRALVTVGDLLRHFEELEDRLCWGLDEEARAAFGSATMSQEEPEAVLELWRFVTRFLAENKLLQPAEGVEWHKSQSLIGP